MEIFPRKRQMHRDHAILDLPGRTAVLSLYARRLRPFLDTRGFIENSQAVRTGMLARHTLLKALAHQSDVPFEQA
jgi:hypothetical protein